MVYEFVIVVGIFGAAVAGNDTEVSTIAHMKHVVRYPTLEKCNEAKAYQEKHGLLTGHLKSSMELFWYPQMFGWERKWSSVKTWCDREKPAS